MEHWPTILDIVEAGIQGDKVECRDYAELWLEKLQADGETQIATHLQRILEGKRGAIIHFAETGVSTKEVTTQVTIDTLIISVSHPAWWEERHLSKWMELVVEDAGEMDIRVGKQITLAEGELPDLPYGAGGNAPITVAELAKVQQLLSIDGPRRY
jgi:hypothetical protein